MRPCHCCCPRRNRSMSGDNRDTDPPSVSIPATPSALTSEKETEKEPSSLHTEGCTSTKTPRADVQCRPPMGRRRPGPRLEEKKDGAEDSKIFPVAVEEDAAPPSVATEEKETTRPPLPDEETDIAPSFLFSTLFRRGRGTPYPCA
mmetsp:Transcript_30563/g.69932  ORF Transcript_30563/g.69932 Transcript_30563/m.69932 type:complete len:146 (-) Transcript_30563:276-713(-)